MMIRAGHFLPNCWISNPIHRVPTCARSMSGGKSTTSFDYGGNNAESWKPDKAPTRQWRREQRLVRRVIKHQVPEKFKKYDTEFEKVVTFEKQLESLRKRGFLRAYQSYEPPQDLDARFMKICAQEFPDKFAGTAPDLKDIKLERSSRAVFLMALEKEFEHNVPNSLIHTMQSVDHAFLFFSTPVDTRTPYEKLHESKSKGNLPPNLHIQLEPKRFDPSHPGKFGVTAFPGSNTVMVTPESRKRYKDIIAKQSIYDNSGKENTKVRDEEDI